MSSDFDFDFKVNNLAPPSQTDVELGISLSEVPVDYIIFKIAYNLLARDVIKAILIGELGQNY